MINIEEVAKEIVEVLHKHGVKDEEGLDQANTFMEISDKAWDLWKSQE